MENREKKFTYYQIYPKAFQDTNNDGYGDIEGIGKRLSLLSQLGINYLLIGSIFKKDSSEKVDFYNIDEILGNTDDLKNLVEKSKNYRIKIILDIDINLIKSENFNDELINILAFWKNIGIKGFRFKNLDDFYKIDNAESILTNIFEKSQIKDLLLIGEFNDYNNSYKSKIFDVCYFSKTNELIENNKSLENLFTFLDKVQSDFGENDPYPAFDLTNSSYPRLTDKILNKDQDNFSMETAFLTLLISSKILPLLYQGQEISARNPMFVDINKISDNNLSEFYKKYMDIEKIEKTTNFSSLLPLRWDDSKFGGFSEVSNFMGNLVHINHNYKKFLKDGDSIFYFTYKLIMLRKRHSAFALGDYEKIFFDSSVYIYKRTYKNDTYIVLINLTDDFYELDEKISDLIGNGEILINNNLDFEKELLDAYQALVIKI